MTIIEFEYFSGNDGAENKLQRRPLSLQNVLPEQYNNVTLELNKICYNQLKEFKL